nr:MAG TPA: hypothetical protein [Caudoviricetes sp.]
MKIRGGRKSPTRFNEPIVEHNGSEILVPQFLTS